MGLGGGFEALGITTRMARNAPTCEPPHSLHCFFWRPWGLQYAEPSQSLSLCWAWWVAVMVDAIVTLMVFCMMVLAQESRGCGEQGEMVLAQAASPAL